jgi:hypothetical protein
MVCQGFYLFTMSGHMFPDSHMLTNSAWSCQRLHDFLMYLICTPFMRVKMHTSLRSEAIGNDVFRLATDHLYLHMHDDSNDRSMYL